MIQPIRSRQNNSPHHRLMLALFVVTILSRLPFASQYLYHWDSVNMAFGLRQFDVLAGAPQFPGYIVYIALGQLVNALANDPQTTMVVISILSSGLAVAALYALGRDLFHPTTGLIAALFLMTSPLVWFYGEIALPHTLDLCGVIVAVWLLHRIRNGDTGWHFWLTAIFLALLTGFRQQNILFLGPLALFALYRIGIRKWVAFGLLFGLVCLTWFIPLMQNTGGLQIYLAGSSAYSASFFNTTSIFHGAGTAGLQRNIVAKLIPYTLFAASLALLPALFYWGIQLPRRWRRWLLSRRAWFIILWVTPALLFYGLIHMGQQGLIFVYLPALLLLSAEGLRRLLENRVPYLKGAAAVIALTSATVFIVGPASIGNTRLLTYHTIREHDQQLADQIEATRSHFSPDNTLLLSSNWRYFEYYLPAYHIPRLPLDSDKPLPLDQFINGHYETLDSAPVDLKQQANWQVILMEPQLRLEPDMAAETIITDAGTPIRYFSLTPDLILAAR